MGSKCNTHNKDTPMYVHFIDSTDIITQGFTDTLGEQLQRKRIELGLLQRELADELGVSRYTIMKIENNRDISLDIKVDIIKKLSLDPEDDYISFLCSGFGSIIRKERARLELTQSELANKLGVSRKTISFWEKEYSLPSFENHIKILAVSLE